MEKRGTTPTNALKLAIHVAKVSREQTESYVTKDGSIIRELLHPSATSIVNQSLAEATVHPGQVTALHRHHQSEEVYHITEGIGRMTLGEAVFEVARGDSVVIRPGTPHCIENIGVGALIILCACAPAYTHDDTTLLE